MSPAPDPMESGPATPRNWLRIVLVASLAINVLVLGLIAGAMVFGGGPEYRHTPRLERSGGPLTRALSRADRQAIGVQMRKAYRETGADRRNRRKIYRSLIKDLTADPYDPDAVGRHMDEIRMLFGDRFELGQTLLMQRLSEMSAEERAAYAGRLKKAIRRRNRD